jgi:hypothetical protein
MEASKNPYVTHYMRKPVEKIEYVFNTEFPVGVPYVKQNKEGTSYEILEGQRVKPGQYVMKDSVGEYPIDVKDFERTYEIAPGQGILGKHDYYKVRVKPSDYKARYEEFQESNLIIPPLYQKGDFRRVGGQYPINRGVFLNGYRFD